MAEGVRIGPRPGLEIMDGAMVAVTDHARPIPPPRDGTPIEKAMPVCGICGTQHFAKTYHIQMRAGSAIVSTEVWANLQRLADNPFVMLNPVAAPPAQGIAPWTNKAPILIEKFAMPIRTSSN